MAIQNEKNKKQTNTGSSTGAEKQKETATGKENPAARSAADAYIIETDENGKDRIRLVPPGDDPTLDPESKEFDPGKWEKYAADANKYLHASTEKLMEVMKQAMAGTIAAQQIANESNSAAFMKSWEETRAGIIEAAKKFAPVLKFLQFVDSFHELQPFLEAELQKPKYNGKGINELYKEAERDENGTLLETSLFMQALNAAAEASNRKVIKPPQHIATPKRVENIEYPLDKINSSVWSLFGIDTSEGQISIDMASQQDKAEGVKVSAYYAINFDELGDDVTITKMLLPFDKRVYIAVSALFNAGNDVITLTQIFYAMGYTGKPAPKQLAKINDSITKMNKARITFDNEEEAAKYKYNHFKYDGSLLPMERVVAIVNWKPAEAAIHIFREPPLMSLAKERKQITSTSVKLLQSPLSKTDANLSIEDYFFTTISRKKKGKNKHCRMLFKTIYTRTEITTKKQEQRAQDKIKRFLDHCREEKFIARYTMQKDGVTVFWQ